MFSTLTYISRKQRPFSLDASAVEKPYVIRVDV